MGLLNAGKVFLACAQKILDAAGWSEAFLLKAFPNEPDYPLHSWSLQGLTISVFFFVVLVREVSTIVTECSV